MLKPEFASQITISTPKLADSIRFYEHLGFRVVAQSAEPNPWAYVTDESLLLLLSEDGQSFYGLTFFVPDVDEVLKQLGGKEITPAAKQEDGEGIRFALLLSPDDFGVALVRHTGEGIFQPEGPTLKNFPQEKLTNPDAYPNPKLGVFGEFCHKVEDIHVAKTWWETLGFETMSINEGPYPWGMVSLGQHIIGLHQTQEFTQPALTYFAKDSGTKADYLRQERVGPIEEFSGTGGDSDNVVITSPEGQHVFLFNF